MIFENPNAARTSDIAAQGDRVAQMLRQNVQKSQAGPSFSNIGDASIAAYANSRNPNSGAYDAYAKTMGTLQERDRTTNANEAGAEQKIYEYLVKAKQLGDHDTAQIKQGLDTLVGDDPMKQQQIIKYVTEKYPDMQFDSSNYLRPALEAVQTLGLTNDQKIFESRKQDLTLQNLEAGVDYKRAAASAALNRTPRKNTQVVGNEVIDVDTGQVIYRGAGAGAGMGLGKKGMEQYDKSRGDRVAALKANAEGAQGFLRKVASVEKTLNNLGSGTGPLEGSKYGQLGGQIFNTSNQQKRDLLQAQIADLELDIAKMKLKGQGQITDTERAIARSTLPKITNNYEANLKILENLKQEAAMLLQRNQEFDQFGGDIDQFDAQYSTPPMSVDLQNLKSKYGLE